jgi:hypothetical protein
MKCISVYTNDFAQFADIYEKVLATPIGDEEEKDVDGVTVNGSGEVPADYVERMKAKPDVVVMKLKDKGITVLQRGDVFEMLIPDTENMIH